MRMFAALERPCGAVTVNIRAIGKRHLRGGLRYHDLAVIARMARQFDQANVADTAE